MRISFPEDNRVSKPGPCGPIAPSPGLVAQLYDELRLMAHRQMSQERAGHTLQTTALVHEAFMRVGGEWPHAESSSSLQLRQQFFQAAAIAMRRILIENARARHRLKRGGGRERVELDLAEPVVVDDSIDWLGFDDALTALEAHDQELAVLVNLRYFAGLSVDQTALTLGVSPRTVDRNWRLARAFLQRHLLDHAHEPE